MKVMRFLALVFLMLSLAPSVRGQDNNTVSKSGAAQYYLGAKDEILMKVNVWGFVESPGQYLVPRQTDLISLISFAGGPRDGAKLKEVRIIRGEGTNGTKGHGKNGTGAPIITVDVKEFLESGNAGKIPALEAGDTVLVGQTFGNKFSRFLGVTSIVGLMAASATLIIAVNQL